MKHLKSALLCILCFLMAAAATCFLRAKYHSLPDTRALYAYDYVSNVDRYSFLQYNQSGADQGRTALLQYLKLLQRIRRENIDYPSNLLPPQFRAYVSSPIPHGIFRRQCFGCALRYELGSKGTLGSRSKRTTGLGRNPGQAHCRPGNERG